MAEFFDLHVDIRVFFNIGIRGSHIGFRLVIVVVTDKVFHSIFREEFLELPVKLGRQGFIVRNHQGRLLDPFDDVGHGEGLS